MPRPRNCILFPPSGLFYSTARFMRHPKGAYALLHLSSFSKLEIKTIRKARLYQNRAERVRNAKKVLKIFAAVSRKLRAIIFI